VDRRGIELSVNFMVIIIIAIVVFFFGAKFIFNLVSEATEIQQLSNEQLDAKISDLLCSGSQKVCIGQDRQSAQRNGLAVFGMKIINADTAQRNFDIIVRKSAAFKNDKSPIVSINLNPIPETRSITLKPNDGKTLGLGVSVDKAGVESGTYIFDVIVCFDDGKTGDDATGKCPVTLSGANKDLYDFKKIYVEVS